MIAQGLGKVFVRQLMKTLLVMTLVCAVACTNSDGKVESANPAAAGVDSESSERTVQDEYNLVQQFPLDIDVSSTKFNETRRIPRRYSCTQEDVSPPIAWGNVPEGTVSLALIVDSDQYPGPLWGHWVIWGIPSDATGITENIPKTPDVSSVGSNTMQGTNNEKKIGWAGPCPPTVELNFVQGHGGGPRKAAYSYFFRLYALDIELTLGSETTKWDLLRAIDGHIIAGGKLVGEHVSPPKIIGKNY